MAVCVLLVLLAAAFVFGAGCVGGAVLEKYTKEKTAYTANTKENTVKYEGKIYRLNKYIKTYLIMGVDKAGPLQSATNINSQQADFIALVAIDVKAKNYAVLYINRDTMTDVPVLALDGTPYTARFQQLALAHTYGSGMEDSCENTANAVSALLGHIKIDHYAALYLQAIGALNDAVGGVTVKVEDDLTARDAELRVGAEATLDARQAEYFVRSRMDVADGTNLNRMKRQMAYISAWAEQAKNKMSQDAGFAAALAEQLVQSIVTDLSVQQISDLLSALEDYSLSGTYQTEGEAVQGDEYMEYYLDQKAMQKIVLELFYKS